MPQQNLNVSSSDETLWPDDVFSVAMRLSRNHNKNFPLPQIENMIVHYESFISNHTQAEIKFSYKLQENSFIDIPFTFLCGAIVCKRSQPQDMTEEEDQDIKSLFDSQIVVCNDISDVNVYVSAEIREANDQTDGVDNKILEDKCMKRIDAAIELGYSSVKLRHMEYFSKRMKRVDVQFDSSSESNSCLQSPMNAKLKAYATGCSDGSSDPANSTVGLIQVVDVNILSQAFQYGRYLMYSSSSRSVPNLQGIWADGAVSAWNGDYHMNINIQEMYWMVGPLHMHESIDPLLIFLDQLHVTGKVVAKDLYNVDHGWVAHGFTDNSIVGDILGDAQWSLCVTCGAWLANQAFDVLSHMPYDNMDRYHKIMPIIRGIVEFFLDYMVIYNDIAYTGPTTSPENSFLYKYLNRNVSNGKELKDNKLVGGAGVITLSPGIDSSVLRQTSSIFRMLIDWLSSDESDLGHAYKRTHYIEDMRRGKGRILLDIVENTSIA